MKKCLMIIAAVVLAAVACSKVDPQAEEPAAITYNFTIADKPLLDPATKSVKTGWEDGDKIYVVFDNQVPTALTDFLILQYASGSWNVIQQPSANNQPKEEGGTLDALYYANPDPNYYSASVSVFDSRESYGKYMWLVVNNVDYSNDQGKISSSFSLSFCDSLLYKVLQICVTGLSGDWSIGIKNENDSYKTIAIWHPKFDARGFFSYNVVIQNNINESSCFLNEQSDGHYLYCYPFFNSTNDLKTFKFVLKNATYGTYTKTFKRTEALTNKNAAITFQGPKFDTDGIVINGWTKE